MLIEQTENDECSGVITRVRVGLALRDMHYRGYHLKTLFYVQCYFASSSLTVHLYTIKKYRVRDDLPGARVFDCVDDWCIEMSRGYGGLSIARLDTTRFTTFLRVARPRKHDK